MEDHDNEWTLYMNNHIPYCKYPRCGINKGLYSTLVPHSISFQTTVFSPFMVIEDTLTRWQ